MLAIPYILCIFYILFVKKTEKCTWLFSATVMLLLSITSVSYADLNNYIPLFNFVNKVDLSISVQTTGIGWACLSRLFYMLGLNYRGMVAVMLYVNYFLMHIGIKKMGGNENLYFGLFLIFPSIIQLVQFKFFTAFCLVFLGYSFLITSEYFSRVKYIISIVIASSIHTSSIVFMLFLLVKAKRYNRKWFAVITVALTIAIIAFLNVIVQFFSRYIDPRLVSRYLTDSITPSSISWIVIIVCVWIIAFWISTYLLSNKHLRYVESSDDKRKNYIVDYCRMSIEVLMLTLPLLLLDRNFHRFLEFGYSVLYVIAAMYMSPPKYSKRKLFSLWIIITVLIIVFAIYTPYQTVLKPIFSFNGIVDLMR